MAVRRRRPHYLRNLTGGGPSPHVCLTGGAPRAHSAPSAHRGFDSQPSSLVTSTRPIPGHDPTAASLHLVLQKGE